ncbi:MAG: DUF2752 domain-containing protein [Deltaproteobacteria bacterium]|nr:DUF2752 domain-containing protein [Deltaproteobacteria bacterium]
MTTFRNEGPDGPIPARLIWLGIVAGAIAVLAVALAIQPDVRGYGTHTQLGLPPCGFLLLTGSPCPGCGLTTAFAHGIRGQWSLAASANPLGLALFFIVSACIPLGLAAALRSWSIGEVVDRFGLNRWALAVAGCAIVVWVVRFAVAF